MTGVAAAEVGGTPELTKSTVEAAYLPRIEDGIETALKERGDLVTKFALADGGYAVGRLSGRVHPEKGWEVWDFKRFTGDGLAVPMAGSHLKLAEICGLGPAGLTAEQWAKFAGTSVKIVLAGRGDYVTGEVGKFDERCDLCIVYDFRRFNADGRVLQKGAFNYVDNRYVFSIAPHQAAAKDTAGPAGIEY